MFDRVESNLRGWWSRRSESTRILPYFLWQAARNFQRRGTRQAAALAYYAIFSLFPLTFLLAMAIGSILGPAAAQEQIINGLSLFLPEETVTLFGDVAEAFQNSGSFGIVAAIGLVWSALGLFSNLTGALDDIFQVPSSRSLWRQRFLAFVMTVSLVLLVATSFITSAILRLIAAFLISQPSIWVTIGIWFLPLGLDVVLFGLVFRYVPARNVHWDAVWSAAMVGAIGLELSKVAFEWYLANLASYTLVYGGLAAGIILLFWAFLIASIFLFSAELCAQLNRWLIVQHEERRHKRIEISLQGGQIRVEAPDERPKYLP